MLDALFYSGRTTLRFNISLFTFYMTLKCKRANNAVVTASGILTAFFKRTIGSQPMAPSASLILVTSKIWRKQKSFTFEF